MTATCLDAGSALQYKLKENQFNISFASSNNKLSFGVWFDNLTNKLIKKRFYNESPAFINYKMSNVK